MNAIYNENDPFAARWLASLIDAGHIAAGRVDQRSIADIKPADVAGPGQRHFFAGIGGWSYACRLAGVADDADIWTGSCPCQPFSDAGKRSGVLDARHLWPTWFELIRECRPPTIFGEQVASRDGLAWLDLVRADLEGCGYAFGASDLCAAGVGAPHIRQRLYFVAHAHGSERERRQRVPVQQRRPQQADSNAGGRGANDGGGAIELGDASSARSGRHTGGLPDAQAQGNSEGREPRRVADKPVDAGAARVCGCEGGDYCTDPGCDYAADRELADAVPAGRTEGRPESGSGSAAGRGESRDYPFDRRACGFHGGQPVDYCAYCCALADAASGSSGLGLHGGSPQSQDLGRASSRPRGQRDAAQGGLDHRLVADADEPHTLDGDESRSGRLVQPAQDATARVDWRDCDWLPCTDGVSRPVEPGTFPLAHGLPARVGRLRGYGNAIVPQVAAVFIQAALGEP